MTDELPFPDVVVRRTHRTRKGNPIRVMNLVTSKAEEWAAEHAPDADRIDGSLVVAKRDVDDIAAGMREAGLIVREISHGAYGGHA